MISSNYFQQAVDILCKTEDWPTRGKIIPLAASLQSKNGSRSKPKPEIRPCPAQVMPRWVLTHPGIDYRGTVTCHDGGYLVGGEE